MGVVFHIYAANLYKDNDEKAVLEEGTYQYCVDETPEHTEEGASNN